MTQFVVEGALLPYDFRPLTDRTLTDELRGTDVRTRTGHVGVIHTAYETKGQIRAFVVFDNATGWFRLSDLDPEENSCQTVSTTSSNTVPTTSTPTGLSSIAAATPTSSPSPTLTVHCFSCEPCGASGSAG